MNGLSLTTTTLDPEHLRAELTTITDPVEIGEGINRLDAWIAALREIKGETEKRNKAIFEAMERRICAVNVYDGLDPESGKRTDQTSVARATEVTSKQQALLNMHVAKTSIVEWRAVREYVPADERDEILVDHLLDEKFGLDNYIDHAKQRRKEKQRREKQTRRKKSTVAVNDAVWYGDMRELGARIESNSVDLILTDPPYPEEFLPRFSDLSTLAARVLKPGGLCLVYSGQIFLPEVIRRLSESLEYVWTFAIRHSGGNQRIFKMNVNTGWKPVIALYKPPLEIWWDSFIDVVSGGREKDLHEWQQSESESAYFVERLTLPGQVVVDPFCGSGTVLKAASLLDRRYIGIEMDEANVKRATERLAS